MSRRNSPFKLTTHFRGWSRVLAMGLGISLGLNFALIYANAKQSQNLTTPRIVMNVPSGVVLPLAASAFVWTPKVAQDYVKTFLPMVYTYSPVGVPNLNTWAPFINPALLKTASDRFQKNQGRIQSDGLNQTLLVRSVRYDPETETAVALGEVRLIDKNGQVARTPLNVTVDLLTVSDPLNAYGHWIYNIR